MATKSFTVCDRCGEVKRETNHWWQATVYRRYNITPDRFENCLVITSLENTLPASQELGLQEFEQRQALCGERCVGLATTTFMRTGRLVEEKRDGQVRTVEG